jgi:hypothetical protein
MYHEFSSLRLEESSRRAQASPQYNPKNLTVEQYIEKDRWNLVAQEVVNYVESISHSSARVRAVNRYTGSCDLLTSLASKNAALISGGYTMKPN